MAKSNSKVVAGLNPFRMVGGADTTTQIGAMRAAAKKEGIPLWILIGVFGAESSFGTAYGPGQTTYGYFGLTSPGIWNPKMTFAQDAEEAAKILKQNYDSHGHNWDAAIHAYSGNSYGIAHVKQMASKAPGELKTALASSLAQGGLVQDAAGAVGQAVSSAGDVLGTLGSVLKFLISPYFLAVLGGGILLIVAIFLITKQEIAPGVVMDTIKKGVAE